MQNSWRHRRINVALRQYTSNTQLLRGKLLRKSRTLRILSLIDVSCLIMPTIWNHNWNILGWLNLLITDFDQKQPTSQISNMEKALIELVIGYFSRFRSLFSFFFGISECELALFNFGFHDSLFWLFKGALPHKKRTFCLWLSVVTAGKLLFDLLLKNFLTIAPMTFGYFVQ